jgi:hypothetical protein
MSLACGERAAFEGDRAGVACQLLAISAVQILDALGVDTSTWAKPTIHS